MRCSVSFCKKIKEIQINKIFVLNDLFFEKFIHEYSKFLSCLALHTLLTHTHTHANLLLCAIIVARMSRDIGLTEVIFLYLFVF